MLFLIRDNPQTVRTSDVFCLSFLHTRNLLSYLVWPFSVDGAELNCEKQQRRKTKSLPCRSILPFMTRQQTVIVTKMWSLMCVAWVSWLVKWGNRWLMSSIYVIISSKAKREWVGKNGVSHYNHHSVTRINYNVSVEKTVKLSSSVSTEFRKIQ